MSFFRSKAPRSEYSINAVNSDPLAVIFNEGQWRLCEVSPMYNLQYTEIKLKQYVAKIRQELVSTTTLKVMKYMVEIEVQHFLKYFEEDPEGLLITVSSSGENNVKTKIEYVGILLSWGVNSKVKDATHLPYLLERGEQRIGNSVKTCLQKMFDCNFSQFSFTQQQMLQFVFKLVEADTSRNTDSLVLHYTTPRVENKNKVSWSYEIGDIRYIWYKVCEQVGEDVYMAYMILKDQISFDIEILDLTGVSSPKFEVKSNGIVKMKSPEIVNVVFALLNTFTEVNVSE